MSRYCVGVLLLLAILGLGTPVLAVDVINKDDSTYQLYVTEKGVTKIYEIPPHDEFKHICRECLLGIEDGVDIPAKSAMTVIIRNGRLKVVRRSP